MGNQPSGLTGLSGLLATGCTLGSDRGADKVVCKAAEEADEEEEAAKEDGDGREVVEEAVVEEIELEEVDEEVENDRGECSALLGLLIWRVLLLMASEVFVRSHGCVCEMGVKKAQLDICLFC